MADGTTYSITVEAEALGADATAEDVIGVADALEAAERVATPFDAALAAAEAQLAKAADASADASAALQLASDRMVGLERAATRAGKAMEKQAMLGKKGMGDVAAYRASKAAADAAAQAVAKQAVAVDKARLAATRAAGAERKLAASMRTLKTSANRSAAAMKTGSGATMRASDAAGALGGRLGALIPRIENAANLMKGMKGAGLAAVILLAAAAFVALNVAIAGAALSALKFAIANDKIAKVRMDKIAERTSKAWKEMFSGLKTEPLLNAMDRFSTQFTQSTAAGRALKALMETIVQPFADAVEAVEPAARELFKGAVLGALKLAIVTLKVRNAILRAIPPSAREAIKEFASGADAMSTAVSAGEVVIYALTAVVAALGWIFTAVALAIAVAWAVIYAPIAGVVAAISWVVEGFQTGGESMKSSIKNAVSAIGSALSSFGGMAISAAGDLVSGLVDGIIDGVGAVAEAAANLAGAAMDAITSKLGISSPAKVMIKAGGFTAEGFAGGIDAGTAKVRTAAERMTSVVTDQASGASTSSSTTIQGDSVSSTRGGNTYQISVYAPTGNGEDIAAAVERVLLSTFEAQAISLGVAPEPEAAT